jgi:predicted nucleic acid-binding protein
MAALRSRRGASQQIVRLIGTGAFRSNISVALALEYEEVLKRGDLISALTDDEVDGFLNYIFQFSTLVASVYPMRPTLSDPDDELVLDLAIQCGGKIVAYSKRDFVEAGKRRVLVLTLAEFLDRMRQAE